MTITSTVYISHEVLDVGDHVLYTVPTATTSRVQSINISAYSNSASLLDVSIQAWSPTGVVTPFKNIPYMAPRDSYDWNGIINLTAGYQINVYIGSSDGGGPVYFGVLVTGEDFT